MRDILFASDLDNTLLYSKRHLPKNVECSCVERYNGEEQGFFSTTSIELLREINSRILFIPITTRSIEQYQRISWPDGCEPALALTTNGAILLKNNERDEIWEQESRNCVRPYEAELIRLQTLLTSDEALRSCRIVDEMFLFASCSDHTIASVKSAQYQQLTKLNVSCHGRKIYFFPPPMNKGIALNRLKNSIGAKFIFCAGDSFIDLPMLRQAQCAFVPSEDLFEALKNCKEINRNDLHWINSRRQGRETDVVCSQNSLFSDQLLLCILKILNRS